jgi:DNA end-binding protein Ku
MAKERKRERSPDQPGEEGSKIRRRAFWSGVITFGLVSVPVALLAANRARKVSLRMTAPDGTPLKRRFFCPKEDRPIEREEIVRGYEYEKDQFVVVTDEELEALEPKKSQEIDLHRFVPIEQIDPMYFDRAYFFIPTGPSLKPYRLLAEVMEKTGRAGIATFVMRDKEYLIAILAENGFLRAETLRFSEEIRSPGDVGLPEPVRIGSKDLGGIQNEIQAATAKGIDRREMADEESERLLDLVERKVKTGEGVIHPGGGQDEEEEEEGGRVIDLMEVLKRSVERQRPKRSAPASGNGDRGDLQNKTKEELYEQAKELDIPGRSAMKKEELIEAIRKAV